MNLILSALWAMEPFAFRQFADQVKSVLQQMTVTTEAGPAEDASRDRLPIQVSGNTAVIDLSGPIVKRPSLFQRIFGLASTRAVQSALNAAVTDDQIDNIVLLVDSPGGTVDGTVELADAVFTARQQKNVIAQVDGMAASAAYFIASQADKIYVHSSDMVGSIGVRIMLFDLSESFEKEGIEAVPIDTGEFKSAGAMGTKITERQREDFQRIVDAHFEDFLNAVARGRKMSASDLKKVSDGRMFTANEALEFGLIDGIQTTSETLADINPPRTGRRVDAARARVALMEKSTRS